MILLYGLAVSAYSMFLWTSIMITDKLVATDKWYFQILLFIGAHLLAFGEVILFLVAIPIYLNYLHEKYEQEHQKRAPRIYRGLIMLVIGAHLAFFI